MDIGVRFTMVLTTFAREDLYVKVLHQYCNIPELERVLLVWNNINLPPPSNSTFSCSAPVYVLKQKENQVQNRLLTAEHIPSPVIFQVDDDIIIHPEDIRLGLKTWKGNQHSMVGFQARAHVALNDADVKRRIYLANLDNANQNEASNNNNNDNNPHHEEQAYNPKYYYSFNTRDKYSILTGAAHFVPKEMLFVYADDSPLARRIRDFVVSESCCDDIAMNFLTTHTFGQAPVWVRAPYTNLKTHQVGGFAGKSSQRGWQTKRGNAIGSLAKIFGYNPLIYNDVVVLRAGQENGRFYRWAGWLQDWWTWLMDK